MSLFDIPAPLFTALDSLLDFLPVYLRLLLWATLTGSVSMVLYWLCSSQDKVEAAKNRAVAARAAMAGYEGTEFGEMWPLAKESLAASGAHFLKVLGPAVLSSLPALSLIVWVSSQFSYVLPDAGQSIRANTMPKQALAGYTADADGNYTIQWPAEPVTLKDNNDAALFDLPLSHRVPVVHRKLWWNSLIANPNGYLPEDSAVQEVSFEFQRIEYLEFGPGWMRGWELSYFLWLIIVSIAIKVGFKIH